MADGQPCEPPLTEPQTLIVEGGLRILGVIIYVRPTCAGKPAGTYAFWIGVVLLMLVWYGGPLSVETRRFTQ